MTSDDHDHQHCLAMFEKLSEYIDGELDHATCEEIEKHARDCVACFSCMETLKKTVALCQNVKEQPIPLDFSKKLQDLIKHLSKTTTP